MTTPHALAVGKSVARLKGAKILDAFAGTVADEAYPTLVVELPDGTHLAVEAWQDAEGNGPGYLAMLETA